MYTNKQTRKYIAAYFDINAKPIYIPRKTKFFILGLWVIFNNWFSDSVQKSSKKMSVLIINEEKETAGINKKNKEHERASYFSSPIFLLKLYTDKPIKK